jgi:hypothetical protein
VGTVLFAMGYDGKKLEANFMEERVGIENFTAFKRTARREVQFWAFSTTSDRRLIIIVCLEHVAGSLILEVVLKSSSPKRNRK